MGCRRFGSTVKRLIAVEIRNERARSVVNISDLCDCVLVFIWFSFFFLWFNSGAMFQIVGDVNGSLTPWFVFMSDRCDAQIYVQCIFVGCGRHRQLDNIYTGKCDAEFPVRTSLNNAPGSIVFWIIGNTSSSIF